MIYEFVVSIGTIIFLTFIWVILAKPLNGFVDTAKNMTLFNESMNKTALFQEYDTAYNFFYYSLFFIVFIILVFIVKKAVEYQKREVVFGG